LRAEGFSAAWIKFSTVAQTVDPKAMTLQYFETLTEPQGTSPASKFILFSHGFNQHDENFLKESRRR
jgi:hypothetical protein